MLFGIAVVLYFYLSITGVQLTYFPGDLGDARFNIYLLEHAYQYGTGQISEFWNAPFMYPEKEVISYSDNLIGSAPFYSVFRILGFDRETAFQLWFILMALLSYIFSYLFLKAVFKNKYAAVIGALIFTVSIALQSQMTHAQVFPRFPIPIAFWFCYLFYKNLKPVYFLGVLLAVVYQIYCGIYLGFLLIIPVSLLLLGIFIANFKLLKVNVTHIKWTLQIILYPILSGLAILPLMMPYLRRSELLNHEKLFENVVASLPTIRSYFYVHNNSNSIWSFLSKTGADYPASYDHQIFVGGIATLALIVFLSVVFYHFLLKKELVDKTILVLFGISALLSIILFTRYQGASLYQYIFKLPGFEALRSLTRIINIILLFFAFSTAFVATYLFKKFHKNAPYLFIGLVLLIVIDNYAKSESFYRTEKSFATKRIDDLVAKMNHIPDQKIVSYEPLQKNDAAIFYQLDAMLATQELHLKSINGYSATSPVGFDSYWRNIDSTARMVWVNTSGLTDSIIIIH